MSSYQDWLALQKESRRLAEGPCVYVVVRYCGYDKDDYLFAYLDRDDAETKCAEINGVPYDRNDPGDFRVFAIPIASLPQRRSAAGADLRSGMTAA